MRRGKVEHERKSRSPLSGEGSGLGASMKEMRGYPG